MRADSKPESPPKRRAYNFIILLGLISLFADITYEGARSITGPFLASLGASAAVVGTVAGLGELIGYGLRLVSGYITDRTRQYWTITIVGYLINLLAVPCLALAGRWEAAVALIIAERFGKAVRTPARDAMLSYASKEVKRGWGFGLHEAMDQIGAVTGPLIVSAILFFKGSYRYGFAVLLVPALIAVCILVVARIIYPSPLEMEKTSEKPAGKGFTRVYWLYLAAVACIAAGYADYPLIAYHFARVSTVSVDLIPVFYAVAMGVDALAALVFGYLFDRMGIAVLIGASLISSLAAPLVFLGGFGSALAGMILWGTGMGAQESVMRAAIADMVPVERRGTAYGVFNTGFGLFWFAGSAFMGYLYGLSLSTLVVFSVAMQLLSVPLFLLVSRQQK